MRLPPLIRLALELFTWRKLLFNRFALLTIVVLVTSGGVVAYVGANDGGTLTGQVVGPNGEPIDGATVTLKRISIAGVGSTESTTTTPEGRFAFSDEHRLLEYRLIVTVDGETVASVHQHLLFRGQNRHVTMQVNTTTSTLQVTSTTSTLRRCGTARIPRR